MKFNIDKIKVGKRIFNIRNSLNLTLEQFGKDKDINAERSNVSKWERGATLPNRSRLEVIAKKGNITVNELLYGSIDEFIENNLNLLLNKEKFPVLPITEMDNFIIYIENVHKINIDNVEKLTLNFDLLCEEFIKDVILVNIEKNIDVLKNKKEVAEKLLNKEGWFNSANNGLLKSINEYLELRTASSFLLPTQKKREKFNNYKVLLSILELPNNEENIELKLIVYDIFYTLLSNIKVDTGIIEPNLIEESILYFSLKNIIENDIDLFSEKIENLKFFFKDIHIIPDKYRLPEYNFLIGLNIEEKQTLFYLANYWELEDVPVNKDATYFILNHDNTYQITKITEIPNCKYIAPIIGRLE